MCIIMNVNVHYVYYNQIDHCYITEAIVHKDIPTKRMCHSGSKQIIKNGLIIGVIASTESLLPSLIDVIVCMGWQLMVG